MKNFYEGNYLKYLLIPLALFFVFAYQASQVQLGIELQGGTLVSLQLKEDVSVEGLNLALADEFGLKSLQVDKVTSPLGTGVLVRFTENPSIAKASASLSSLQEQLSKGGEVQGAQVLQVAQSLSQLLSEEELASYEAQLANSSGKDALELGYAALGTAKKNFDNSLTGFMAEKLGVEGFESISFRTIGPSLGKTLFEQARLAALVALVFTLGIVFYFFRTWLPSIAIVLAVTFDVLTALAGMSLFGVPLTLASLSAIFMIVGYSVDTDILLTTRVLKRHERTARERAHESMVTGITITATAFASSVVLLAVAYFTQMTIVVEIATVIMFGLLGGFIAPWLMNAPMLLWLVENKKV